MARATDETYLGRVRLQQQRQRHRRAAKPIEFDPVRSGSSSALLWTRRQSPEWTPRRASVASCQLESRLVEEAEQEMSAAAEVSDRCPCCAFRCKRCNCGRLVKFERGRGLRHWRFATSDMTTQGSCSTTTGAGSGDDKQQARQDVTEVMSSSAASSWSSVVLDVDEDGEIGVSSSTQTTGDRGLGKPSTSHFNGFNREIERRSARNCPQRRAIRASNLNAFTRLAALKLKETTTTRDNPDSENTTFSARSAPSGSDWREKALNTGDDMSDQSRGLALASVSSPSSPSSSVVVVVGADATHEATSQGRARHRRRLAKQSSRRESAPMTLGLSENADEDYDNEDAIDETITRRPSSSQIQQDNNNNNGQRRGRRVSQAESLLNPSADAHILSEPIGLNDPLIDQCTCCLSDGQSAADIEGAAGAGLARGRSRGCRCCRNRLDSRVNQQQQQHHLASSFIDQGSLHFRQQHQRRLLIYSIGLRRASSAMLRRRESASSCCSSSSSEAGSRSQPDKPSSVVVGAVNWRDSSMANERREQQKQNDKKTTTTTSELQSETSEIPRGLMKGPLSSLSSHESPEPRAPRQYPSAAAAAAVAATTRNKTSTSTLISTTSTTTTTTTNTKTAYLSQTNDDSESTSKDDDDDDDDFGDDDDDENNTNNDNSRSVDNVVTDAQLGVGGSDGDTRGAADKTRFNHDDNNSDPPIVATKIHHPDHESNDRTNSLLRQLPSRRQSGSARSGFGSKWGQPERRRPDGEDIAETAAFIRATKLVDVDKLEQTTRSSCPPTNRMDTSARRQSAKIQTIANKTNSRQALARRLRRSSSPSSRAANKSSMDGGGANLFFRSFSEHCQQHWPRSDLLLNSTCPYRRQSGSFGPTGNGDSFVLESFIVESWLDDHPDFVHDYLMRKATNNMIDDWLIAHAKVNQSVSPRVDQGASIATSLAMPTGIRFHSGANNATEPRSAPRHSLSASFAGGSATSGGPVRKISATDFESHIGGQSVLGPMVSTAPDGKPTFLAQCQPTSLLKAKQSLLNSSGSVEFRLPEVDVNKRGQRVDKANQRQVQVGDSGGDYSTSSLSSPPLPLPLPQPAMLSPPEAGTIIAEDSGTCDTVDEMQLIFELVKNICDDLDIRTLLHKILKNIAALINADKSSLFLVAGQPNDPNRHLVSQLFNVDRDSALPGPQINSPGSLSVDSLDLILSKSSLPKEGTLSWQNKPTNTHHYDGNHVKQPIEEPIIIPWGTGIVGYVAQSGRSLNIANCYDDPRFTKTIDQRTGYITRHMLCAPIYDKCNEIVGVAQVINKRNGDSFSRADELKFKRYLQFCGIGLRNAQSYESCQLENRRNQVLLDLARMVFEEQSSVEQIVHRIMLHTQSLLECQRCQVLLIDDGSENVVDDLVGMCTWRHKRRSSFDRHRSTDDGGGGGGGGLEVPLATGSNVPHSSSLTERARSHGDPPEWLPQCSSATTSTTTSTTTTTTTATTTTPSTSARTSASNSASSCASSSACQGLDNNGRRIRRRVSASLATALPPSADRQSADEQFGPAPTKPTHEHLGSAQARTTGHQLRGSRARRKLFSRVFDLECDGNDLVLHKNKLDKEEQRKAEAKLAPDREGDIISSTDSGGQVAKTDQEDNNDPAWRQTKKRFPINFGITGYVAMTGETLNIEDAYRCPRFDPAVDEATTDGFRHRSILCMPIRNGQREIVGVIQLINKKNGRPFNKNDENLFEAFAIFCGLGIQNTLMYERVLKIMAKQRVTFEVLSYHATAPLEEAVKLNEQLIPSCYALNLASLKFNDFSLDEQFMLKACLRFFLDLDLVRRFQIDKLLLCNWLLSVQKNYRKVTYHPSVGGNGLKASPVRYHNWRHAFNVTQMMFAILVNTQICQPIGELETLALIIACLCHDLDHRGTNNSFQIKTSSPLAQLYSTSTMEHHHFDQCVMILNSTGNQILENLSPEEYSRVIELLQEAILATDLANYFERREQFFKLVNANKLEWRTNAEHRSLLRCMLMTACDVAAITKPWPVQKVVADLVMSEFYQQGDIEKNELKMEPIDMMNRDKMSQLPAMQIGFIDSICAPIYSAFARLFPIQLETLLQGCLSNRELWTEMAANQETTEHCNANTYLGDGQLPPPNYSADDQELDQQINLRQKEPIPIVIDDSKHLDTDIPSKQTITTFDERQVIPEEKLTQSSYDLKAACGLNQFQPDRMQSIGNCIPSSTQSRRSI